MIVSDDSEQFLRCGGAGLKDEIGVDSKDDDCDGADGDCESEDLADGDLLVRTLGGPLDVHGLDDSDVVVQGDRGVQDGDECQPDPGGDNTVVVDCSGEQYELRGESCERRYSSQGEEEDHHGECQERYIKSMKYQEDKGFGTYTKTIDENTLYQMVEFTKNKIEEARDSILDADFSINPKKYDGKNISCEFCSFKDLCYQQEKDVVYLDKVDDLSFLGGEE